MQRSFKNTLSASVAFVALGLTAGIATAAGNPDGDWYRTADETVDQGTDQDAARAPETQSERETNQWSDNRREGHGKWRNKRRHAGRGRGRGRIYDQDFTKAQFFDHMMDRFQRMDADGNGFIDQADIEARQARRQAEGRRGRGRHGGRFARRMERLDANADGKVTPEEFATRIDQRFARLDRNKDGRLNQSDKRSTE